MGHYASFYDKQGPPPVIAHESPVYASRALSANMVSVLEDYYCPDTEDNTFSTPAILKKNVQKAGSNIFPEQMFPVCNRQLTKAYRMMIKSLLPLKIWMS